MGEFAKVTAQVQFWAEIGQADGGGMGYMDRVDQRVAFPSYDEAEAWLTKQGWVYSRTALRRVKEGKSYGLAKTRRVNEFDPKKWIDDKERDDG